MSSIRTASRSTPKTTLWSFAAVLGFALPYFIYSKRSNEAKKKERHIALRQERQGGAFSQMAGGEKVEIKNKS